MSQNILRQKLDALATFIFMQTTNLPDVASRTVNIDILPTGFSPKELTLALRTVTLRVQNLCKYRAGAIFVLTDFPRPEAILERRSSKVVGTFDILSYAGENECVK